MDPCNILLTGGTGFFGRALIRHYLSHSLVGSSTLTILSRNPAQFVNRYPSLSSSSNISLVLGDIMSPQTFPCDKQYTHVIHAATDSTLGPSLQPLVRYAQIVEGTKNLLQFAVDNSVHKFLLTSSGGVYGPQPTSLLTLDESYLGSPPLSDPAGAYCHGKRAAEHLCALYNDAFGLEYTIARCFAFVGRDLPFNVHFAIGNLIFDALREEVITIKGDGTPIRSYLDQRDLALWLWTLLFNGSNSEVYNIGSDHAISILELAHTVRDTLSPGKEIVVLGKNNASPYRNRYVPDIQKINNHFGLQPNYSLVESICEAARYC